VSAAEGHAEGRTRPLNVSPVDIRFVVEAARAGVTATLEQGFATLFLLAAALAVVSFAITLFLKEVPLRSAAQAKEQPDKDRADKDRAAEAT